MNKQGRIQDNLVADSGAGAVMRKLIQTRKYFGPTDRHRKELGRDPRMKKNPQISVANLSVQLILTVPPYSRPV